MKNSITETGTKPNFRLGAIMQRLIIHSIIVLACYYICNVLLWDDGWVDIVHAICWSGNAFWLPDYAKWVAMTAN